MSTANPMNIVAVKFRSKKNPSDFSAQEYTYYTTIPLNVGDLIDVPTARGSGKAIVSQTGLNPENILPSLLEKMRIIDKALEHQNKTSAADFEILQAWDHHDDVSISTEQLLARVSDETGYEPDKIIDVLYRHRNVNDKRGATANVN